MKIDNVQVTNLEFAIISALGTLIDSQFGLSNFEDLEYYIKSKHYNLYNNIRAYIDYIEKENNGLVSYTIIGDKDMQRIQNLPQDEYIEFLKKIFVSWRIDDEYSTCSYWDLMLLLKDMNEEDPLVNYIWQLPYATKLIFKNFVDIPSFRYIMHFIHSAY